MSKSFTLHDYNQLFLVLLFFFLFLTSSTEATEIVPCDPVLKNNLRYTPRPTTMLNGKKLPWRCEGKVKVFELTADEVMLNFTDHLEPGPVYTWGYNGSTPGPVIEVIEGETVRINFKNNLPEATTVHWHGLHLPFEMDGGSVHKIPPVPPGGTYIYEFPLQQSGTYMYHSGHDIAKQLSLGTSGFFIVHPKDSPVTMVDHDYLIFLHMWTIPPHSQIPDVMDMNFNFFTINGKSFPDTSQMKVKMGEKVRIRFANLSMMTHPIHIHGHTWRVVANGAGDNPESTIYNSNTIQVPTGENMDVIIDKIEEPGEWFFHCHLPHHVTNNMHGVDPVPGEFHAHGHGGMFTLFNVMDPQDHGDIHIPMERNQPDHGNHHHDHLKNTPQVGNYEGSLMLENGRVLQANFQLFKIQSGHKWRKLSAFLKVFLGNENSSEYLVFYYPHFSYNFAEKVLSGENKDKGLSLIDLKFSKHHESSPLMIKGKFRSDFTGLTGTMIMHLKSSEGHLQSGLDALGGEYFGTCGKGENFSKHLLQLETLRGLSKDNSPEANPFFPYLITGRKGKLSAGEDENLSSSYRLETTVRSGVYDPFEGKLLLHIDPLSGKELLNCRVSQNSEGHSEINCGDCRYRKRSSLNFLREEKRAWKALDLPTSLKVNQFTSLKNYSGQYYGSLHHESRNLYQRVMLQVQATSTSIMPMVLPTPSISAVLNLYFNDGQNLISYKFSERPFLDSSSMVNTQGINQLGFASKNGFFIVEAWRENSIEGVFYHREFGRVGKIQLIKGHSFPNIPKQFPIMKLEVGNYLVKNRLLTLDIGPVDSFELDLGNPFFPLNIEGRYLNLEGQRGWSIQRGSYNFFTGDLTLLLEDDRVMVGKINSQQELSLFISSVGKRRVRLQPQIHIPFQLQK